MSIAIFSNISIIFQRTKLQKKSHICKHMRENFDFFLSLSYFYTFLSRTDFLSLPLALLYVMIYIAFINSYFLYSLLTRDIRDKYGRISCQQLSFLLHLDYLYKVSILIFYNRYISILYSFCIFQF